MATEIRRARPDDLEALVELDFRNFGQVPEQGDIEAGGSALDLDRFLVGDDGGRLVAAGGSYAMELTVPGGGLLPLSGVTWVSVAASHRRQGLLRRLLAGIDEMSAGFGEPVQALTSSEGGIYERFGYGVATRTRLIEIDRRRTAIHPRWRPEPVELVVGQDHVAELMERWDRFRRARTGEVSRSEPLFRAMNLHRAKPSYAALHPDGYAIYEIESRWNDGHPAHLLRVGELVAVTPEAHLALWHLLLSVDLVGPIRSRRAVSLDDPLPHLLTDPRALRTTDLNDGLWVKVTDAPRCFGSRTYRVDDELVIGVVETVDDLDDGATPSETVAVGRDGARADDRAPDLVACRSALGPLLLGTGASRLAAARRVRAEPSVLHRADLLLGTTAEADCRTPF